MFENVCSSLLSSLYSSTAENTVCIKKCVKAIWRGNSYRASAIAVIFPNLISLPSSASTVACKAKSKMALLLTTEKTLGTTFKAGFHLNFGVKMNFCFFSKLATLTT